jgi:multimeric flavodoxin WrbA
MKTLTRRDLVRSSVAAGAAVATATGLSTASPAVAQDSGKAKIIGIACSPRPGKTTAASLRICLEAARQVSETIDTELIELAGLKINGNLAAGIPLEPGEKDDFPALIPKLADRRVRGIIIGTPVYFGNMSSLCKAFLDRCIAFYGDGMALSNKVAGVLAVGGTRNGGQEVTVRSVQASLFCQEMIIVGNGRPASRYGATLWSGAQGGVTHDEFGINTAKNLGRRVAEVALRMQ